MKMKNNNNIKVGDTVLVEMEVIGVECDENEELTYMVKIPDCDKNITEFSKKLFADYVELKVKYDSLLKRYQKVKGLVKQTRLAMDLED
jgi:hypothetical protein